MAITTGLCFLNGGFAGGPCPAGTTFGGDGGGGGDASGNARTQAVADFAASRPKAAATAATVTSGYVHVFKLP